MILCLAVSLVVTGCNPTPPEIAGTDYKLRELEKRTTPTYTPRPIYKPSVTPAGSIKGKVIVIDAGHGGKDPGTLGIKLGSSYGLPEKTVNIDIAKKLAAKLTAMGATVKMTRTTDVFIELDDRAAFASRYNADAFISIHADYIANPAISGPTCFVARQASPRSVKIADTIIREFELNGIRAKGTRRADYKVLVQHPKPAVLVEVGFMSNYNEVKMLNTATYRSRIANIIAEGIAKSF